MKNIVNAYVRKFKAERRKGRRALAMLLVLAMIVAFGVNWQLSSTGIAMTNETYCGHEEHTHDESCYESVLVCELEESEGHTHDASCYETQEVLICGLEESEGHTHTEDCYDEDGNLICILEESEGHTHDASCYEMQEVLTCGQEESEGHTHDESCYEEQLVCGKEEHTHDIDCMTDETADVETAYDWEATLPDDLSGIWAEDVVAIAESQLGYTESTANFVLGEDGETRQGYTRYGAWYGNEYGDWDAMFVSFCLYYADVDEDDFPQASGAYAWTVALNKLDLYAEAEDYEPLAGDIVFLDTDDDGEADHVGIVTDVNERKDKITVIEGDCEDAVCKNKYDLDDEMIIGYGILPEQEGEKVEEAEEVEETAPLTQTYTGDDYIVTVTYTAEAEIPENAELIATEYAKDSETYLARYAEAAALYGWEDDTDYTDSIRLFNIGFYDEDGLEIEPAAAVQVTITYLELEEETDCTVTHFASEEIETVETESSYEDGAQSVSFGLESFSDVLVMLTASDSVTAVASVTITDNIAEDGTFVATLYGENGNEITDYSGYTFTWYKSSDGISYEEVTTEEVLSANTINVAEDQGGLCYYYVVVTVTDDEESAVKSNTLHVDYATELLNGTFEDGSTYWNTTAGDGKIEIGQHSATPTTYGAQYAPGYEGAKFAELNANMAGSLYQDVLTAGGTELYWSLLHRARNGNGGGEFVGTVSYGFGSTTYTSTDTMYVVIMSTSDATMLLDGVTATEQQSVLTAMIESVLASSGEGNAGSYTLVSGNSKGKTVTATVWTITTTSTLTVKQSHSGTTYEYSEWVSYNGEYTVPEGQYLTRFFFVSGQTQYGGNNTVGNLLDDVSFSQDMAYTIEYWVWDSESGAYVLQSTATERGTVSPYSTVYASNLSNYSDYALVGSVTGTSSGGSNPSDFDSSTKTALHVSTSTNHLSLYFKKSGVTVVKQVEGLTEEELATLTATENGNSYSVEVSIAKNGTTTGTLTIAVDETGTGSGYIDISSTGTYTISESFCDETVLDGSYKLTSTTVKIGDTELKAEDGVYSFDLTTASPSATITITNTYEPASTSITLKKVDADTNEPLKGAVFTLSAVGENDRSLTVSEGTLTVEKLNYNTEYTLTESSAPDGYNLLVNPIKFTINTDGNVTFTSGYDSNVSSDSSSGAIIITVTNKAGFVLPSTGGPGTIPFVLAGLLLCGGAVLTLRRRKVRA